MYVGGHEVRQGAADRDTLYAAGPRALVRFLPEPGDYTFDI